MEARPNPAAPIQCEICLKEIPQSEAIHAEARDYVAYFCGIDCYGVWVQQNLAASAPATGAATREGQP